MANRRHKSLFRRIVDIIFFWLWNARAGPTWWSSEIASPRGKARARSQQKNA